ncbi:trypsin 3A1-like [Anthonomus grandis grandis]|uniref:trypsin 3A1-like n=1 Tax=Anthonomus grandis grandis TaxID=2921223 RepID=UPI0021669A69|nr:trypsin 3A1-like [Anthonomus grandis grandis]
MTVYELLCLLTLFGSYTDGFPSRYSERLRLWQQELRIIGGNPADIRDYPYQVLLIIGGKPSCGGSIIREDFVLTAAHCIYDVTPDQIQIRAGTSDRTTGGQLVNVQSIKYPEDSFNIDTFDYDVAILQLDSPLIFNEEVAAVALPDPDYDVIQGEYAVATGWGQTDPDDETLPNILQSVELPEIPTEVCTNYYGSLISSRMFCAGYEEGGKDTCLGDSGGPLVVNRLLIGITSWGGDRCAQSGYPGVFTKVAYFRDYIDDVLTQGHSKNIKHQKNLLTNKVF